MPLANQQPPSSFPAESGGHLPLALLRQYVAGTLPAAEQHRVEAHTLDCERCADVLEGLALTDAETTDRALVRLQSSLRTRVAAEAPPRAVAWPRLAAVVALLVVAGSLIWLVMRQLQTSPSSASVATVTRPAAAPSGARAPFAAAKPAAASKDYAVVPEVTSAPALSTKPKKEVALNRRVRTAPAGRATKSADNSNANHSLSDIYSKTEISNRDSVAPAVAAEAQQRPQSQVPAMAMRTRMAAPSGRAAPAAAATRHISGRVMDKQSGTGLPGATVLVKGTDIGVSTGADGSFLIAVPKDQNKLLISSIGFQSQELKLNKDSTLALALAADPRQLNEVVVTSVPNSPMPASPSIAPTPAAGFSAYQEYLKQELKYPQAAADQPLEGTVKLRFTVTAAGMVTDIKVVKGLSAECDREAIRLVQEGPAWRPGTVNGRRADRLVRLPVVFKLP